MAILPARKQSVRIPKAAEIIARKIKRRIVLRELKEGELLPPEVKLMEEFGVSRPTIREAYRILEAEHLVSVTRGAKGGAVVHRPDVSLITSHMLLALGWEQDTVAEVYDTRAILEPSVVRRVAEIAPGEAPAILQPLIDKAIEQADNSDAVAGIMAEFFVALLNLCDNHMLQLMYLTILEVVGRHQAMAMSQAKRAKSPAQARVEAHALLNSYQTLINLISEGKGVEAEAHWRRHISYVQKTWVKDYNMLLSELFPEYN